MPSELDLVALAAEAEQLNDVEGHRWEVSVADDALRVWVRFTPIGSSDVYCVRLDFGDRLSAGPPSATFCDPDTHAEGNPRDWPAGMTSWLKHPPQDVVGWICNEWTREGRAHHAEWKERGWRATRVIWRVMSAIQDIIDKPGNYQGRHTT